MSFAITAENQKELQCSSGDTMHLVASHVKEVAQNREEQCICNAET